MECSLTGKIWLNTYLELSNMFHDHKQNPLTKKGERHDKVWNEKLIFKLKSQLGKSLLLQLIAFLVNDFGEK